MSTPAASAAAVVMALYAVRTTSGWPELLRVREAGTVIIGGLLICPLLHEVERRWPSGTLSGRAERTIVLHAALHPPYLGNQVVELFFVMHEIDLVGVDDEKGGLVVVEEEIVVRLRDFGDVRL